MAPFPAALSRTAAFSAAAGAGCSRAAGAAARRVLLPRMMCTVPVGAAAVVDGVAVDENGEPLSKNALKKLAKAAQVAKKKAEKAAAKAAAGGAEEQGGGGGGGGPAADAPEPAAPYSFVDAGVLMSTATPEEQRRVYAPIRELGTGVAPAGQEVWVRGRVSTLRAGSSNCFLVLRGQGQYSVQVVFFKDKATPLQSKAMLEALGGLTEESVLDVRGTLVAADVKSCSQSSVELQLIEAVLISAAAPKLPFEIADAGRSEAEIAASEGSERPFPRIGQDARLNSRWIDLRVASNQAIMRTQSAICTLFREALLQRGFVEIHTPKLIAGESETGAGVFTTDYFGQTACLAQSPQLYKQMAIASDLERVFEIGPVFRAEKSNTRRHLCEFTGLDLEMSFNLHYNEVRRAARLPDVAGRTRPPPSGVRASCVRGTGVGILSRGVRGLAACAMLTIAACAMTTIAGDRRAARALRAHLRGARDAIRARARGGAHAVPEREAALHGRAVHRALGGGQRDAHGGGRGAARPRRSLDRAGAQAGGARRREVRDRLLLPRPLPGGGAPLLHDAVPGRPKLLQLVRPLPPWRGDLLGRAGAPHARACSHARARAWARCTLHVHVRARAPSHALRVRACGQRVHDPELLIKTIESKGASVEALSAYVDAMRHGMPPHGGGGVGLERVVFLYLGLDNVRKASMFPRDPTRVRP